MHKFYKYLFLLYIFIAVSIFPFKAYSLSNKYIKVKVYGDVFKPGVYVLKKGSRLSDLLFKIWPIKKGAYLKDAFLYRKSLKKDNKVELRGLVREILHLKGLNHRLKEILAKKLTDIKATGRLVVHLKNPILLMNTPNDIRLKNNDELIIPNKSFFDYVYVTGDVNHYGKIKFKKGMTSNYYISKAGGIANHAVAGYYYLIEANGYIKKIHISFIIWNKKMNRWEFSLFKRPQKIEPGDVIFIPINYGKITDKLNRLLLGVYKRTGILLSY